MIISVANQKGGAKKTTTTVNLAAGLVLEGYKVLFLDMDPQTNTTQVFLHPDVDVELEQHIYNSFIHYTPITPLIRQTGLENLDFVPAHIRMSGVDLKLAHVYDNRSARLSRITLDLARRILLNVFVKVGVSRFHYGNNIGQISPAAGISAVRCCYRSLDQDAVYGDWSPFHPSKLSVIMTSSEKSILLRFIIQHMAQW